jgi:hypothetical protein
VNRGLPGLCYAERAKGHLYHYVRIGKGRRLRLTEEFGTEAWRFEYAAAVAELKADAGRFSGDPDSTRLVVADYLASPGFAKLKPSSACKRRRALEKCAAANAERPFSCLTQKRVEDMIAGFASPHAAVLFWKAIRKLCQWALAEKRIATDPTAKIPEPETPEAISHERWYPEARQADDPEAVRRDVPGRVPGRRASRGLLGPRPAPRRRLRRRRERRTEYEIMALLGDRSPQAARVYVQQANAKKLNASAHAKRAQGGMA